MDYEATDRYMSSWVISCVHNGVRFYLTDNHLATDIPDRAMLCPYIDHAEDVIEIENRLDIWPSYFAWKPYRVAEMMGASR